MDPTDLFSQLIEESRSLANTGQFPAAIARARQALELATAQDDHEAAAQALTCTGLAEYRLGNYAEVRRLAEQALRQTGAETRARVEALILLGVYAMELGSLDEMEAHFLAASDLARRIGYEEARYRALHDLSCVNGLRGQFDLSNAADEEAYQIAVQLDLPQPWIPLIALGYNYLRTGQVERTRDIIEKLSQISVGNLMVQGFTSFYRAFLTLEEGEPRQALRIFAEVRSLAEQLGDPSLLIFVCFGYSRSYRLLENGPAALQWAEEAVKLATRSRNSRFTGRALTERARAYWLNGDPEAAEADLHAAVADLDARSQGYDLACARFFLAALLDGRGDPEAPALWLQAVGPILKYGYAHLLDQERSLAYPLIARSLESADPQVAEAGARCIELLQRQPPEPLQVRTLGDFEVRRGGQSIKSQAWRQRRAGELFRLLLVSPRHSLANEQIFEALWPDKPPGVCQGPFHQATSALRRTLEPELPEHFPSRYLTVEDGFVRLRLPPGSRLDFQEFEALLHAEDPEAAIQLYQGDLFPYDLYVDWAAGPRERLRRSYLQALMTVARRHSQAGRHQPALEACARILEHDGWNEEAALLGMQACLALGDRSRAIEIYRRLERTLRTELNVAPQPAVRRLFESLF